LRAARSRAYLGRAADAIRHLTKAHQLLVALTCIKDHCRGIGILIRVWASVITGVTAEVGRKALALGTLWVAGAFIQIAWLTDRSEARAPAGASDNTK
jgi:hypothetical protein